MEQRHPAAPAKSGGKLRKFLALPAEDRARLLRAAAWLPLIHARLKLLGLRPPPPAFQAPQTEDQRERARRCEHSVAVASRHGLVAGTCLSRALTVLRLMAREGLAGELRIGVNLDGGQFAAHAWVEFAGEPLGQGGQGYEAFPPPPTTNPTGKP